MLRLIAVLALAGTARAVPVPYRKSRAKAATARYDRGSEGDRSPAHDRHAKVTDLRDQSDDDQPPGHGADGTELERRAQCKDRITVNYAREARDQCLDQPGCYLCIAPTTWSWDSKGNEFRLPVANEVKPRAKDRTVTMRHYSFDGDVQDSDFILRCKKKQPCGEKSEAWYAEGPKQVPVKSASMASFLTKWWQKALFELGYRVELQKKEMKEELDRKLEAYRAIPETEDETTRIAAKLAYQSLAYQYKHAVAHGAKILRENILKDIRGSA